MNIVINNNKIIEFFKSHSTIDVESFLLNTIDFYDYVSSSINNNNTNQILPYILSQSNLINNLIDENKSIKHKLDNIDLLRNEQVNTFKDIQHIIINNNNDYINITKDIINNIEKNMMSSNNNTINIINDFVKTINSSTNNDFKEILSNFDKRFQDNNLNIISSTKDILNNFNKDTHKDFSDIVNHIDKRLLENNSQLINSNNKDLISLTKDIELITTKSFSELKQHIDYVKDKSPKELDSFFDKIFNDIQHKISSEFSFLQKSIDNTNETVTILSNKFLNSSHKGRISENILENELSKQFPSFNIVRTSSTAHAGDFILSSNDHPSVIIENKEYDKNVNSDEIAKFIRDLKSNNMSGILISQTSGIANKQNFEIEFFDNKIAVYIHKCNYNMEHVQLALDIIFSLSEFFNVNKTTADLIDHNTLQHIQKDYLLFIQNRNDVINSMNEAIKNLKKIDICSLKNILDKYANKFSVISTFSCSICQLTFHSKPSLSAHMKKHKNKNPKTET